MRGDYGRSLADIEQVLKLEPRHWGALSGLAIILNSMERKEEALEVMNRALAVHPFLEKLKQRRDRLARELEGADI
jgi:Flp pilus assembly protein TadD